MNSLTSVSLKSRSTKTSTCLLQTEKKCEDHLGDKRQSSNVKKKHYATYFVKILKVSFVEETSKQRKGLFTWREEDPRLRRINFLLGLPAKMQFKMHLSMYLPRKY